jgi:hypothetical protein
MVWAGAQAAVVRVLGTASVAGLPFQVKGLGNPRLAIERLNHGRPSLRSFKIRLVPACLNYCG